MLSASDASHRVIARVPRLAVESVALVAARDRVLATDIVAERASPGFDNSAMDGYAVRAAELPATLPLAGVVAAGGIASEVPAGHCVRIFTGAPLPPGMDSVVIQEDITVDAAGHIVLPAARVGDNVRRAGEDIAIGEVAITAGTRLTAWHLGVLAALGVAQVPVARRPRVALIATGDELVEITTPPQHGQLVDSSAHALLALVAEAGGIAEHLGIVRDDLAALTAVLERALAYDVVITTGGVSVGDRDHVRPALEAAGVTLELYKVAMKPGKPFSFGMRDTTPVFGLPGNPVSTVVGYELFVRPALLAMQGAAVTQRPRARVQLLAGYRKPAGRAHYLRARVERSGEHLHAHVHAKQGSAMLSSLVTSNALVEVPAEATAVDPGASVSAILLEAV